jgi:FdhD protein
MDKLVGNAVKLGHTPITDEMVVVSGRASFELVQKSLRAGFPVFISVGAPSSLAVDLANEHGMTLICFVAETRMTVFSGSGRIEMQQHTDKSA